MALLTYHLISVSNSHLILGNLLLLVRLDVGCGLVHQVLGLGSRVLVYITSLLSTQKSTPVFSQPC